MSTTLDDYQAILSECQDLFAKKTQDYGTAWRILRLSSLTDQIFIKAKRIRSIQEKGKQAVEDPIRDEFIGIINYCLIALVQAQLIEEKEEEMELSPEKAVRLYKEKAAQVFDLFQKKNHDYGEAWRDMRVASMTDLILMKLLRIKQIEDNAGETLVSEGVEAGYMDMMNYAIFCLILL